MNRLLTAFALLLLAACGKAPQPTPTPWSVSYLCTLPNVESLHSTGIFDSTAEFKYRTDVSSDGWVTTLCSVANYFPQHNQYDDVYGGDLTWHPEDNEAKAQDCSVDLPNGNTLKFTRDYSTGKFATVTLSAPGQTFDGAVYSIDSLYCIAVK